MKYIKIISLLLLTFTMINCTKEEEKTIADYTFLVDRDQLKVTFNSAVQNASTFEWDFGDGETSTDEDPIHIYSEIGTYNVTFKAKGNGGEDFETKEVIITASTKFLLTGGPDAVNGKPWYWDRKAYDTDGMGTVTTDLTIDLKVPYDNLIEVIELPQGYKDVFTFKFDGSYIVDNSDTNGGSIMSMFYANKFYKDEITHRTNTILVPLVDATYTVKSDTKWELSKEDFIIKSENEVEDVVFENQLHLVLGEYFGFKDYTEDGESVVVILKDITETKMKVAISVSGYIDVTKAKNLAHFTFTTTPQ